MFSSVHFSQSVMSDSLRPHESQHAMPPCPSPSPVRLTISLRLMSIESVMPSSHLILCRPLFSCPQSFPASGSFQMSQLFTSGGQSIGISASTSVLPMYIYTHKQNQNSPTKIKYNRLTRQTKETKNYIYQKKTN